MAYEDTNPFTGASAYDAPAISQPPPPSSAQPAFVGGDAAGPQGAWSGFEEANDDQHNLINKSSSTGSPGSGLFAGLNETDTLGFTPQNTSSSNALTNDGDGSEFVSLSFNAQGSWNDGDMQNSSPKADSNTDLMNEQGSSDKIEVAPTDKEARLAAKYAFMPWGCWTICTPFETPLAIHWSFILVLIANVGYSMFYYEISFYAFAWAFVCAFFWVFFVLVNQFAHILAAKLWGVETRVAVMWMFGGYRETIIAHSTMEHFKVSIAGPLSHVPWMVLFGFGAHAVGLDEGHTICYCVALPFKNFFGFDVMNFCFLQNLWLFGWNLLLPCYPLDGSLIMTCFLLERGYSPDRVLAIMMRVSGLCFVGSLVWVVFTRHLWAIITAGFLLWSVVSMCWYLGRADKHPLFGLRTTQQLADENAAHAGKLGGALASNVAMYAVASQVQNMNTSSDPNGNNAYA